jgi:FkbM family methyltransferase
METHLRAPPLVARFLAGVSGRVRHMRIRLRRAWYADRPWIGRLVALSGNRVAVDGCRFTLAHPLVTDAMRARIVRGRYESAERELLNAYLDPDAPVIECGGGLGMIATLVNRRLKDPRKHLVVEGNPSLIPLLEQQKRLNGAAYTIVNGAIDYSGPPVISLSVDDDFISGRVGAAGTRSFEAPALTLRTLVERQHWKAVTLICDIEGSETEVVEHESDVLARFFDMLFIEAHPRFRSVEQLETMFARLEQFGFVRIAAVRKVHAFRSRRRSRARGASELERWPR